MVAEKTAVTPAVAQLRGEMMTLLVRVEDEELLQEMFRHLQKLYKSYMLEDMPPHVLKELEIAIEESYDESDTIPHEEVMKMARQWAKE